jgi:cysteinyl-tRNA synthetase
MKNLAGILVRLGELLGLLQDDPESWLTAADGEGDSGLGRDEIEALIEQRNAARANKDWAESDRIRDELQAQGVILEDGPEGTSWRREG